MLQIKNMDSYYGDIHILHNISLRVEDDEIVCLLGRNGVGKTTTFKSIMGATKRIGLISFCGEDIAHLKPYEIAKMGIGYVPEDRRIFPNLTVTMNLKIALRTVHRNKWDMDRVFSIFPQLRNLEVHRGDELSGGEQQMLAIARALVGNPMLILMDEPTEGLAPLIKKMLMEKVLELNKEGVTLLLAEQNSKMALSVSNRCYVLVDGRVSFEGRSGELIENEGLRRKLLGIA